MRINRLGFAWLGLVIAAASCSFDKSGPSAGGDGGADTADGGPGTDGTPGSDGMQDACESWQPEAPFSPCDIGLEDRDFDLNLDQNAVYTIDTANGTLQIDDGTPEPLPCTDTIDGSICLLSVASVTVGSNAIVRVVGDKALLIASWSTIEVAGEIDASSARDGDDVEVNGAGANPTDCPSLDGGMDALGPGGGGGGGLATPGGGGGDGAGPMDAAVTGGPVVAAIGLRGGCPGGNGGRLAAAGDRADGGSGGGAIALSAFDSIRLTGAAIIQAGGAGGLGGLTSAGTGTGGGGGGSGGVVWLDAPTIELGDNVILAANGGGGGEGGDSNQTGTDGDDARGDAAPQGGSGGANQGGDGGDGVSGNDSEGQEGALADASGAAGGGGGGGGGLIRLSGDADPAGVDAATITPDPPN